MVATVDSSKVLTGSKQVVMLMQPWVSQNGSSSLDTTFSTSGLESNIELCLNTNVHVYRSLLLE